MISNTIRLAYCLIMTALLAACESKTDGDRLQTDVHEESADTLQLPIEVKSAKLTLHDGLPSNSVIAMNQDEKGFMWFGTYRGLARYDGSHINVYRHDSTSGTADDSRMKLLTEDSRLHYMWVRTVSGTVLCLDMATGKYVDYMQGAAKPHFTHFKLTAPGRLWMWGKTDGAMLVTYGDGTFHAKRFTESELGTNSVSLVDTLQQGRTLIYTHRGLFLHDGNDIVSLAQGKTFAMGRAIGRHYYLLGTDGMVYMLNGRKLLPQGRIGFRQGEKYSSGLTSGTRWVVFTNRGAHVYDTSTRRTERLRGDWDIAGGKVVMDNKGGAWVFNRTGVLRRVMGDRLISLDLMANGATNYVDAERYNIVVDNHGLVWISTYGNGLFVFSHDLSQRQHFVADEQGLSPIASNYLLRLLADRHDGVWVSAEYGGVAHIQVMNKGVEHIYPNGKGRMDKSNVVRMVAKAPSGDILVSTRDGSLLTYDAAMTTVKSRSHFDANVYSVMRTATGETLYGTRGKGVQGSAAVPSTGRNVFAMSADRRGRIWIGTYGGGLTVAEQVSGRWHTRTFFADSVGMNEVRCVRTDRNGYVWIGMTAGLMVVQPDKFLRGHAQYEFKRTGMEVHDIWLDGKGHAWLTAPDKGLVMVDVTKGYAKPRLHIYDSRSGLINDMPQSIAVDRTGDLWVSTQQGVSRLDMQTMSFDNHIFDRNMMANVYNENSAVCLDDGRILLGGNYGLTLIRPSSISVAKGMTDVVFTSTPYSDCLELAHSDNSPEIFFSTLDFSDVSNVKYTYWLEGLDRTWSTPSPVARAIYRNLPTGSYTLHVKACYSDGVWGKESTLHVTVHPPLYLSPWAVLLYIVIVGAVAFLVIRNINEKRALRSRIRLEQELTKYKLVFFTNIAHEFRTPLTLIQGSLEKQANIIKAGRLQGPIEKTVRTMEKSAARMLRLIDQLLEFRKMQAGKLRLALAQTEVVKFVSDLCHTFDDAAESKGITFTFDCDEASHVGYIDRQHVDKIVFNLLSNAFKYTPSGGTITVHLSFGKDMTISVADTGVGIPPEKRASLFSRFTQSAYTGESFGIGLHLTHELVTVHHGTISYAENPGGGSVFTVSLPIDKAEYAPGDFLVEDNPILKDDIPAAEKSENQTRGEALSTSPLNGKKVLLIEDDNDVRDFLTIELSTYFETATASDGMEGLAKAKEWCPDLVVSDVMMPGMNGFEVCKRLKNSFDTSHIPVILLTAMSNTDSQLEGMESGADSYVTKPFSPQLLVARIFQLLDQRERLRQKFSRDLESVRTSLFATDQDEAFIRKVDNVIKSKIGDKDLTVDKIAEMLHMGRTQFYRKVRGVTGYTPNEYIRTIRLKRAAEMIREGEKNISEIAYAVGFDTPYYFSRCFKTQFGVPPTQYK